MSVFVFMAWLVLAAEMSEPSRDALVRGLECVTQAEYIEIRVIKGDDRSREAIISRVVKFCTDFVTKDNPTIDRRALQSRLAKFADDHFDSVSSAP